MKILVRANDDGKSYIDFEAAFKSLNAELSKANISLELVCAGGYVLQLHGFRGTADVDAFYQSNQTIEDIIQKVGNEFGINADDELWLNNSISNFNPKPPEGYCEEKYQFSNLVVKVVTIDYLIGMKLSSVSGRELDIKDVINIVKREKKDLLDLLSKFDKMGFDIDISHILNAFEGAYGMEWLEDYYINNEAELRKYY